MPGGEGTPRDSLYSSALSAFSTRKVVPASPGSPGSADCPRSAPARARAKADHNALVQPRTFLAALVLGFGGHWNVRQVAFASYTGIVAVSGAQTLRQLGGGVQFDE